MLKCKEKCCALLIFWNEINFTFKLVYYHFAYNQSKSNSTNINLILLVFDWAEQFEDLTFVWVFDTNALVNDQDTYLTFICVFNYNINYSTLVSKLYSVR